MVTTEVRAPAQLGRLGRASAHHPFRVIGSWLLPALVLGTLVSRFGAAITDDMTIPGADSQAAIDTSREAFPTAGNPA